MQLDAYQKVFGYVGYTCTSIFIAGGAVADYEKAGDIDLWIGNDQDKLAHNVVCKLPYRVFGKGGNYGGAVGTRFIGQGYVPELGKIVQVICHKWGNAVDLMDTFDISTHCYAYTSLGQMVVHPLATPPYEKPQIIKWRAKTQERYIKICQRYEHEIDLKVLEQFNDNTQAPYPNPIERKPQVTFDND